MNTVFLDIETTGLNPRFHEILEVAMLVHGEDTNLISLYHFSLPIDVDKADPYALEVNRYYERQDELESINASEGALTYFQDALTSNVVVGNNVQFDLRFIEQFLVGMYSGNNSAPWQYHPVDLKALVAGRYQLGPAPWSTKQIAEAVGVPIPKDAHSALADAQWNRDVYYQVMEQGA